MKALFVDTSAWVAAADAADPLGAAVRRERDAWLAAGGTLVTTDYVVDETLTTIRLRLGRLMRHWQHLPQIQPA